MKTTTIKTSTYFNLVIKLINLVLRLMLSIGAIGLIFIVAYYFGSSLLIALRGGDTANNLSIVHWFAHWYPNIPLWYPLQGGGVSLLYGYHFLSHLFVVIFQHQFNNLTPENWYQILGFMSVPITSLGIYLFVWTRLKNQTVAIVAALYYFISPISWVWLTDWGFFGEAMSYIFLAPTILFFDVFISNVLEKKYTLITRLSLLLSVLFFVMAWLTHAMSLLGLIFFFPFYTFVLSLFNAKGRRIQKFAIGVLGVIVFFAFTYLISAFHEINFQYYSLQTGNAGSASKEFFIKDASEWYIKPFLSLEELPTTNRRFAERNVAFSVPVWLFALVGVISSFWHSKKVFAIGLWSMLAFIFIFYPAPVWQILNLSGAQHYRPLIISLRIFLPILAGFGISVLPKIIFGIIFFWRRFLKGAIQSLIGFVYSMGVSIATLIMAVFVLLFFRYYSSYPPPLGRWGPQEFSWGRIDDRGIPAICPSKDNPFLPVECVLPKKDILDQNILSQICSMRLKDGKDNVKEYCEGPLSETVSDKLAKYCQSGKSDSRLIDYCGAILESLSKKFSLANLPELVVKNQGLADFKGDLTDSFLKIKGSQEYVRVDISPNMGGLTQSFNMDDFKDSSISLWGYQSSLNHSYWGYQQNTFYGKEKSPALILNVSKWFGTKYIFLNTGADPLENFTQDPTNWEFVNPSIAVLKDDLRVYSYSSKKPTAIVIGSQKLTAYETIFKLSTLGVIDYNKAFLVMGKEKIDDYSLEDLRKYDLLILFGYSYSNQNQAYDILEKYISGGGKVFLSSGWQYSDRDWQIAKAPDFYPVDSVVWNANTDMRALMEADESVSKGTNVSALNHLSWGGKSWGIAVPGTLRPNSRVLVSFLNKPLVVERDYGKGRIIWSGLNWPGHIDTYKNNPDEIKLLANIFSELLPQGDYDEEGETSKFTMTRSSADKVTFTATDSINSGNLYFRESFHPDWKAYIVSGSTQTRIAIDKAGPLYKLVHVPALSNGDRIVFVYSNGSRGVFANFLTIVTGIVLILNVFVGQIFIKKILFFVRENYTLLLATKLKAKTKWGEE